MVNVIQLGVGSSFAKTWRRGLSKMTDLHVVGLVDIDSGLLEEARLHFGLPKEACSHSVTSAWLEEVKADFVIDSTPHASHYQNALEAFRAGLDVIVAKPMSDSPECAEVMVQESRRWGRKLVVAQQIRHFPPCVQLHRLVTEGAIGAVAYAHVDAFFSRQGPVRPKWFQPYPLLLEAAIHHFDLMRFILSADPVSVMCESWNMPWNDSVWGQKSACAVFCMESGARVTFRGLATDQPGDNYPGTWTIEGTEGVLHLHKGQIRLNGQRIWPEDESQEFPFDLAAMNERILAEAAAYFRGGPEPAISGQANLPSLRMVFGAIESSRAGRRVSL